MSALGAASVLFRLAPLADACSAFSRIAQPPFSKPAEPTRYTLSSVEMDLDCSTRHVREVYGVSSREFGTDEHYLEACDHSS